MTKFPGNIDDYFASKALLREQLTKAALGAQAKRQEVLDFAARFGAKATKARQVQSRLKQLEKMEVIEVQALPVTAKIRLPEPNRTGKIVVQIEDSKLGYGEKVILRDLRLELKLGDHLGVVGLNGAGKSTLLKALAGELLPLSGEVKFGQGVEVSYFAQHVAERLNPEDTVVEAIGTFAKADVKRQDILDLAGSLLFSGDDMHKKVRVLSGGEKSRVALGQVLLKRASCLLLDEPTNHLDFDTVEALTQALASYAGTVVTVSHDRGFVRRIASKILEIHNGRAEFYPGSYDEYVWSVQKGVLSKRHLTPSPDVDERRDAENLEREKSEAVKFNYKDHKKQLEREIRLFEKEMASIEKANDERRAKVLGLTEQLLTVSGMQATDLAKKLADLQAEVDQSEHRYLECLEEHDRLAGEVARLDGA